MVPPRKVKRGGCVKILLLVLLGLIGISFFLQDPKLKQTYMSPREQVIPKVKLDFKWGKAGFDNMMEANFTIDNQSDYSIADIVISCEHFGKSGTNIDSNTKTIYDVIPAKKKKRFEKFNMGFIHSQVESSACRIKDLSVR